MRALVIEHVAIAASQDIVLREREQCLDTLACSVPKRVKPKAFLISGIACARASMSGLPVFTPPPACPFSNTREIHLLALLRLLTGRAVSSCIIANSLTEPQSPTFLGRWVSGAVEPILKRVFCSVAPRYPRVTVPHRSEECSETPVSGSKMPPPADRLSHDPSCISSSMARSRKAANHDRHHDCIGHLPL
jgi:hypothetical protein